MLWSCDSSSRVIQICLAWELKLTVSIRQNHQAVLTTELIDTANNVNLLAGFSTPCDYLMNVNTGADDADFGDYRMMTSW
jgi:hypothetical protein